MGQRVNLLASGSAPSVLQRFFFSTRFCDLGLSISHKKGSADRRVCGPLGNAPDLKTQMNLILDDPFWVKGREG